MVVGFDLEGYDPTVPNPNDAGVFARTLNHVFAFGGEFFQVDAGAFVRAVLAPHDFEDAEFGGAGFAAEERGGLFVLGCE